MFEPVETEADPAEAVSLAQALGQPRTGAGRRGEPDRPREVRPRQAANPVEFKSGGVTGSLMLGNKNPTQGEMYALKGGDKKVFLVVVVPGGNFNRTPFNLRDKKILKFDREKADALRWCAARTRSSWRGRAASGKSSSPCQRAATTPPSKALGRLSSSNMSELVESDAKDLEVRTRQAGDDDTVGAGSAKTVLLVGKTENDKTYARDASRPLVFTVDTTLQGDLTKSFDEYRKKELFEFRAF